MGLVRILSKCDDEKIPDGCAPEQPLFIDESQQLIKCTWCSGWVGSSITKVINQHVRKSASHRAARSKKLNCSLEDQGVNQDIRSFFI